MKKHRVHYLKNTLFPLMAFSAVTGAVTGAVIFLFKIASSTVISLSGDIYAFFRADLRFLPLLLLGAAGLGLLAWLILHIAPDCRGGGIPSAIAALRGQVPIQRIISLPLIFVSSLLTYLCGVPLGTEGPSVQMGTLIGWLTSRTVGRRAPAWHRYTMTGGACAGFAAATGAPLTGIFFAFEEAHRRFTPMIFMVASVTTVISSLTMELLCLIYGTSPRLFDFSIDSVMPLQYMWSALIVGIICGIVAIFFTKTYKRISDLLNKYAGRIPYAVRIVVIFVAVALIGIISSSFLGTGHHLIDELVEGHGVWYLVLIYLLVRTVLLMVANTQGVTGGLFIPSLAIGAMIGMLCGNGFAALGLFPREYCIVTVVIGMVSFLAASSRVPITALAFALEALSGLSNFLPIAIGVAIAFAVIETFGIHSFNDTVVDLKIEERNQGREVLETEFELIVQKDSFVIGYEVRDILWPPNCIVVSVIKDPQAPQHTGLGEGDMLCVHYRTAFPEYTADRLEELVGDQENFDF